MKTNVLLQDEADRLQHLRALLAIGLEQADRGELIELTPEFLDEINREVDERFSRDKMPNPDVGP
jgi:hypothetical protein